MLLINLNAVVVFTAPMKLAGAVRQRPLVGAWVVTALGLSRVAFPPDLANSSHTYETATHFLHLFAFRGNYAFSMLCILRIIDGINLVIGDLLDHYWH